MNMKMVDDITAAELYEYCAFGTEILLTPQ